MAETSKSEKFGYWAGSIAFLILKTVCYVAAITESITEIGNGKFPFLPLIFLWTFYIWRRMISVYAYMTYLSKNPPSIDSSDIEKSFAILNYRQMMGLGPN